MKFFFVKIFFIFLLTGISNANENIKFININYIVNNSEAGKALNKIIENKSKLRSSTGVALNLMTPVGPLSFSFANALTKASTDKTETFRFNLGTQF